MRKFSWIKTAVVDNGTETETLSLLEMLEENKVLFWASIRLKPTPEGKYELCAWQADRKQLLKCEPDADSIGEARAVIMEYMKKRNIITKKDIVEYA